MIFIVLSLLVYSLFSASGSFQQVATMLVFLVILPILFNSLILKRGISFYGIGKGDYKQGIIWSAYSLLAISFIFLIMSYYFNFLNEYSVPVFITKDFVNFLFYEFIIVVPFVAVYEFYFRGFLMPIFETKLGYLAVLLQAAVLLILVLINSGSGILPFVPYLIFAPFGGFIAYKSRSILYSGATQFIILLALNLIVIKKIG